MAEEKEHARLSPSSMARRIRCPGSLALEEQCPNISTAYADEGTAAHSLGEQALKSGLDTVAFAGGTAENGIEFDDDMVDNVQIYVDTVREEIKAFEAQGATVQLLVEQEVDFSEVVEIPDQFGTADAILIAEFKTGKTLISVEDLKYGMGVRVEAEGNEQLMTYGLAIYYNYCLAYDIDRIRLVIHQPRLNHVSECELTTRQLREFAEKMIPAAKKSIELSDGFIAKHKTIADIEKEGWLRPDEKACRFCRGKAFCPALAKQCLDKVIGTFESYDADIVSAGAKQAIANADEGLLTIEQIGGLGLCLGLVEDWTRAIRARIEASLLAGVKVPGWKLVEGRKGRRYWTSISEVEELLKSMRYKTDEIYNKKLKTPPQLEKTIGKTNPKRWTKLKEFYEQKDGLPSVDLATSKRPEFVIKDIAEKFEEVDEYSDLC